MSSITLFTILSSIIYPKIIKISEDSRIPNNYQIACFSLKYIIECITSCLRTSEFLWIITCSWKAIDFNAKLTDFVSHK